MAASAISAVISYFPSAFGGTIAGYTAKKVTIQTGATIEAQVTETGSHVRDQWDRTNAHAQNRADELTKAGVTAFEDVRRVSTRAISRAAVQSENVGKATIVAIAHTARGAKRVTETAQVELRRVGGTTDREVSKTGQVIRNESRRAGNEAAAVANVAKDEIRTTCKTLRVALLVLTAAGFAFLMYLIADKSCASDRFPMICNSSVAVVFCTALLGFVGLGSLYRLSLKQTDANSPTQMPQLQKLIGRGDIAEIAVKKGGVVEISPCDRNDRITVTQSDFSLHKKKVGLKYTIKSEKFQEDIRWLVRGPHSFKKS